jgi:CBS domain-containing protein
MSDELDEEYSADVDRDLEAEGVERVADLLEDPLAQLADPDPICAPETMSVYDAIQLMLARRHAGVLIVDRDGRLAGIFTERDVLTRVAGRDLDTRRTPLRDVMTANPEALEPTDRVAYALHSMRVAGYRTIPLVDKDRRPIGVVTLTDVVRWLGDLFPETILNVPPGGRTKRPDQIDMG